MSKNKRNMSADSFIVTINDGEPELHESSILNNYTIKADRNSKGSKQVEGEGWENAQILRPRYDPDELIELLDLNTYHERCVDAVATDASGKTYAMVPVADENQNEKFNQKEVNEFLEQCYPDINTLLYRGNYDHKSIGYGALELIRESTNNSPPLRLTHINAHTLRRHNDGFRVIQKIGKETVYFVIYGKNKMTDRIRRNHPELSELKNDVLFDVDADTGDLYPYNSLPPERKANELLWEMDYAPGTNYYGRPKIIASLGTILGDLSRGNYNTSFFKNYGMPSFAVTITGDFQDYDVDPEDPDYDVKKTLKYKITQQLKEVMKNPHSAVVVTIPSNETDGNVEVNIQPLSVETKDASFRLYRKDNRDEIIHAHGVDPSRLGIYDSGKLNGSNSKTVDNSYKISTVAPLKAENEKKINRLLREEFGVNDWKFKINTLDPKDNVLNIGIAKELWNMGAMTGRELIENFGEEFGLNKNTSSEYLDEYYVNGTPAKQLWQQTEFNNVYNNLEKVKNDLISEAEYNEEQEESDPSDSNVGISTKTNASFTERIKQALSR